MTAVSTAITALGAKMIQLFDGRRDYRVTAPEVRGILLESLAEAIDIYVDGKYRETYFPATGFSVMNDLPFWAVKEQ